MQLEHRDRELAAIGASIGCDCRPCIEHRIPAGRKAGLSEAAAADAVTTAQGVRDEAIELLALRVDDSLGATAFPPSRRRSARPRGRTSWSPWGRASAPTHPLFQGHIIAALEVGLSSAEVAAAARMAGYDQKRRARAVTADKATHTLGEPGGVAGAAAGS